MNDLKWEIFFKWTYLVLGAITWSGLWNIEEVTTETIIWVSVRAIFGVIFAAKVWSAIAAAKFNMFRRVIIGSIIGVLGGMLIGIGFVKGFGATDIAIWVISGTFLGIAMVAAISWAAIGATIGLVVCTLKLTADILNSNSEFQRDSLFVGIACMVIGALIGTVLWMLKELLREISTRSGEKHNRSL